MNTYYSPLDDIRNYDNVYDTFFEDAYFKNYYKSDGTYFGRYYWLNMVGY